MSESEQLRKESRFKHHLLRLAPYSVLERGEALKNEGHVLECAQSGYSIRGLVRDAETQNELSVNLKIISATEAKAECHCSSPEDMEEQWCQHAMALALKSFDLGFFSERSGFEHEDSSLRMNMASPEHIAEILGKSIAEPSAATGEYAAPDVDIQLLFDDDRLGIQVLFDGEAVETNVFTATRKPSARPLDNILIEFLDEQGHWDESRSLWFLSNSRHLEYLLGILSEYQRIVLFGTGERIAIESAHHIDAEIELLWNEGAAELTLLWEPPLSSSGDNQSDRAPKVFGVIGTGPYWTLCEGCIYKLSTTAARLAALFPYAPRMVIPLQQSAPLLEALSGAGEDTPLRVLNPEATPESKTVQPSVVVQLAKTRDASEHFSTSASFEVGANVIFEYPKVPAGENIVYLRDRVFEESVQETLRTLGFSATNEQGAYTLRGDTALDLISGTTTLPTEWTVQGLKPLKSQFRFSELELGLRLGKSDIEQAQNKTKWTAIDWFECRIDLQKNNSNLPISSLFRTQRIGEKWVQLEDGSFSQVPAGGIESLKGLLSTIDPNFRLSNKIRADLSTAQAMGLVALEARGIRIEGNRTLDSLKKRVEEFSRVKKISPTKGFKGQLRDYQVEGLSWLAFLHDFAFSGILADEMGLGKTVQTLALIQLLKDSRSVKRKLTQPALIVTPTSVMTNWVYEARRFTPDLKVLLLHGPRRRLDFAKIPEHDIIITSYALLRLDRTDLERQDFSYVILDEAQNIKNPSAAVTRAAKSLSAQRRIALTGTPTENRALELWSIFDFLMPGYLGGFDFFKRSVEKAITEQGVDAESAQNLQRKIRPFILRRAKAEVEKQLPKKIESELVVPLSPSQTEIYNAILAEVRPELDELVERKGIKAASISILAALLRLRQVCNHPRSISAFSDDKELESGKFELFKEVVSEALDSGRKLLVFSQFLDMLSIMEEWLGEIGASYVRLDGSTKNRQEVIDRFSSDESIRLFLISLKAGGTGLNLSAADTVVLYDPWWNPAVENQAIDRAHRIGQTRSVQVYRLITEDTIEQKIMLLKERKAKLFSSLIEGGESKPFELSTEDLQELFKPLS